MYKKVLLYIMIIVSSINLIAQEIDSTKIEEDNFFKNKHKKHWWKKWEYDWSAWELKGKPFMEFNYGLSSFEQKDMTYDFAKVGLVELKLGYSSRKNFHEEKVVEFRDRYFFVSRLGANLKSNETKLNELNSTMWRFGFSKRSGYGYKLNEFFILPYNSIGIVWAGLDMKNYPPMIWPAVYPPLEGQIKAEKDAHFLDRINQKMKFGITRESGINLNFASSIGVNIGYETSVLFPRYLVWKHFGSFIVESIGYGLLDRFIDEVSDSSPISLPFVNFLLKGAYQYAFYSLTKDKMNWPFDSEAPLTYETLKFGITYTF